MLALILLALGVVSRVLVHVPNFTPVIAIVLFCGVYLDRKYAVILPLVLMVLSDMFLGFYDGIMFNWLAITLSVYVGLWVRARKNFATIFVGGLMTSLIFFVVSNFGVWATGYYGYTFNGLRHCFVAAIPFYRDTLTSTVIYGAILFGIYELVALKVKDTRLARVLLTT